MNRENGGQAFPVESDAFAQLGMTLRDYFAAKAMQAMIANNWPITGEDGACTAGTAYQMADAMLASRSA